MSTTQRQLIFAPRPDATLGPELFELREAAIPQPDHGQVLIRNLVLSCDPAQVGWLMSIGASLVDARVDQLTQQSSGFEATLEGGQKVAARFVILSEGKSPRLAQQLGLTFDESAGLEVDINGKTSVPGVYAVGRLVRPKRSQAIISAGDGAAAAIDILSIVKGQPVQDWDSPPKS